MAGRWDIMALLGFHVFLFFCPRVSPGNGDDDENGDDDDDDDECARLSLEEAGQKILISSACAPEVTDRGR